MVFGIHGAKQEIIISDELTQMTASRMDELLAQFIMEARSQDSEVYPPKTLFQIIASLQRHLREMVNLKSQ